MHNLLMRHAPQAYAYNSQSVAFCNSLIFVQWTIHLYRKLEQACDIYVIYNLILCLAAKKRGDIVKSAVVKTESTTYMILYDYNIVADVNGLDALTIQNFKEYIKNNYNRTLCDKNIIDGIIDGHYYGINLCLIPSNICNLRCQYCYSKSGTINTNDIIDADNVKMAIDTVFNNYRKFSSYYKKPINILFHGGGEPTCNWDGLRKIVEYTREQQLKYGIRVILKLLTNGILSNKCSLWVGSTFDEVVFSIDGMPEINDIMRPFPDGTPSTMIAMNAASIVSKLTNVGVHSVVSNESKGKGEAVTKYFLHEIPDIKYLHYERYRTTRQGRNNAFYLSNKDFIDFVFDSIKIGGDLVKSSIIDTNIKRYYCRSCNGNMIYCFPNNMVSLCNEHDDGMFVIGNYIGGINISKEHYLKNREYLKELHENMKCESCFAFPFCRGGCRSFYMQCDDYKKEWCEMFIDAIIRLFEYKFSNMSSESVNMCNQSVKYIKLN